MAVISGRATWGSAYRKTACGLFRRRKKAQAAQGCQLTFEAASLAASSFRRREPGQKANPGIECRGLLDLHTTLAKRNAPLA